MSAPAAQDDEQRRQTAVVPLPAVRPDWGSLGG